jgi:hypothetical protein
VARVFSCDKEEKELSRDFLPKARDEVGQELFFVKSDKNYFALAADE